MMLLKLIIPRQLLILIALAIVMVLARVAATGSTYYLFLLWNIFLALVPFIISIVLLSIDEKKRIALWLLIILGLLWLSIFPNAPYLVTDVVHLRKSQLAPMWFDALMFFSVAWAGMVAGLYSLSHIEKILRARYSNLITWIVLVKIVALTSFGIYLGRFLRWNSWDVVASPYELASDVWNVFSQPELHQQAFLLIPVFFVFIFVSYLAWRENNV